MSASTSLFVVTQDTEVMRDVAGAVGSTTTFSKPSYCADLDELVTALEKSPQSAVIVDIDSDPSAMPAELEPIVDRFPYTRLIVIAGEQQLDWMIQAMQAGARHFLIKRNIPTELLGVLQRLAPSSTPHKASDTHAVVTILSAGGGCGATTLAVNLADELHRLSNEPSLLVDLDCCYGGAGGYLGITAEYGIADVLADPSRIDPDLIRSSCARHGDRLHLLASPATVQHGQADRLAYGQLSRALRSARCAFTYTVVDAPRLPVDVTVDLARASDLTVIVLELNIDDIRIAHLCVKSLLDRGVATERILAIVNRYQRRGQLVPWSEAKRALDSVRLSRLTNDYAHVAASINYGKPLAELAPRSRVRRDIQALAKSIHDAANNGRAFEKV